MSGKIYTIQNVLDEFQRTFLTGTIVNMDSVKQFLTDSISKVLDGVVPDEPERKIDDDGIEMIMTNRDYALLCLRYELIERIKKIKGGE